MSIKVDKGIEIPDQGRVKRKGLYPFEDLEIGDSFFVPDKKPADLSGSIGLAKTNYSHEYISRSVEEDNTKGVRIWRTS